VALPIGLDDERLDTPAILVDLDIVDVNIIAMASFAEREGLALRPHTKTHKSIAMAQRQLAAGALGLSVANHDRGSDHDAQWSLRPVIGLSRCGAPQT
jgi:D-serine deaminase-like pyridoxal phosphate-dependent protein